MTDLGTSGGDIQRCLMVSITVVKSLDVQTVQPLASIMPFYSSPGGVMTDLGTLGGDIQLRHMLSITAVKSLDMSNTASGRHHAFLYSGGKMTDLGTLRGEYKAVAYGINDSGQIVGFSYDSLWHRSMPFYTPGAR